jgi:hypothetical protein
MLPLFTAATGMIVLAWCGLRVRRDVEGTYRAIDQFGRELRPALLRVRDDTARTRRRLDPDD